MKKKGALILILLMIVYLAVQPVFGTTDPFINSDSFRNTTYIRKLRSWLDDYEIRSDTASIAPDDIIADNPEIPYYYNESYGDNVFAPIAMDMVYYPVIVPAEGLYRIALDYYYDTAFSTNPQIAISVNDEIQYNELSKLKLEVDWESLPREEAKRYNRYGDELIPDSVPLNRWYHYYLEDVQSGEKESYYLLLKAGLNQIGIQSLQDDLLLGKLYLGGYEEIPSYKNYSNNYPNAKMATEAIVVQAESYVTKNDVEIKPGYYNGVAMTPSNHKNAILNLLDGNSTSRGGVRVDYQVEVPETGFYRLSLKYKQNSLAGLAVARNIYINGKIPFKEVQGYLFAATNSWVNHTIGAEEPYLFYLEEGIQTISLESTTVHIAETVDSLYRVMEEINSLGLTIKSITSSSEDTMIDWNLTKYLPNLAQDLNNYADRVEAAYDYVNALDPESRQASEVSILKAAANQLRRLAKSPNKVQNRLGELCDGSGSAYQFIGNTIGSLVNERMDIDYFVFHPEDYKLKSARGNIFARFWYAIKTFFYSFFDPRYKITSNREDDVLEVWVAQSSLYVNILQNMVDTGFTEETGIQVRLNVLPSSQKLILNNATGTNPDVVLSIDSWEPYTYALRGMLEDLRIYPGFEDIVSEIYPNNFIPVIYEDGVYAIPETQGMQLLFYRTDIFDFLNLEAPNTWDDVLNILPVLQSSQMNYYHPLGHESAFKGFGLTSPFFYMMGAEVYSDNGFTTVLNQEENIEALRFMTDIFNIYNLPQQVASFFEHFRSGTLPIGLGSIDLYLQIKYACPELTGQWAVLPIPGFFNPETGEIERWTTTYGKSSIIFSSSKMKDEAWEFLRWYHRTDTQIAYVQNIKMYLGERYMIVPANIESLKASPWDEEIKTQIISQARWSRIPAITPGSYIIEREISNIWNKVVIDKMNVRVAVNESIAKINRELSRKFEEFHYLEKGKVIKEYIVPNHNNVSRWVKGRPYEE
ncbi:MAG: extracellular solute-binding protein [Acholeplasmataceae bacterium]|nr:extracellular solute-binding protein [Acholeplasmataceae bacterium]